MHSQSLAQGVNPSSTMRQLATSVAATTQPILHFTAPVPVINPPGIGAHSKMATEVRCLVPLINPSSTRY